MNLFIVNSQSINISVLKNPYEFWITFKDNKVIYFTLASFISFGTRHNLHPRQRSPRTKSHPLRTWTPLDKDPLDGNSMDKHPPPPPQTETPSMGREPPVQLMRSLQRAVSVADLGGRRGRAPPPRAPKFFRFHAVFGKIWQNRMLAPPWGVGAPLGKSWIRRWVCILLECILVVEVFIHN